MALKFTVHGVQSFIKGHRKSGVISIKHSRDITHRISPPTVVFYLCLPHMLTHKCTNKQHMMLTHICTYLLIAYCLLQPALPTAGHVPQLPPLVLQLVEAMADGLAGQLPMCPQLLPRGTNGLVVWLSPCKISHRLYDSVI